MFPLGKTEKPLKREDGSLLQFGLTDIPDDFDPSLGYDCTNNDASDSDLEAELAAIAGEISAVKPTAKSKPGVGPVKDLDKMIADSLKDVTDDEDDGDGEIDPRLLGELQSIVGEMVGEEIGQNITLEPNLAETVVNPEVLVPTTDLSIVDLINQRIQMYKTAETNAKESGESSKMRRFKRGLKTLNDLLKQANLGKTINLDDIPPEVSLKPAAGVEQIDNMGISEESQKISVRQAPLQPVPLQNVSKHAEENTSINLGIQHMRIRQQEYKVAAIQAKRSENIPMATQFLKVVKQFDVIIKMCEDGQEVDLSDMPPPPAQFEEFMANMLATAKKESVSPTPTSLSPLVSKVEPETEPNSANSINMLEALQQRLSKYRSVEASAKSEENASKARRFGRIVKQYEDAIIAYKAGRLVAYDELPIPPGFGPLPVESNVPLTSPKLDPIPPSPPTVSMASSPQSVSTKRPSPTSHIDLTTRISGNQQKNNLAEQQMKILIDRQKEFKVAAIEAKKAGEIDQAKEYLKIYKGFDALLNAASSGLPVDLNTLPVPPSERDNLESSFAIISAEEGDPNNDISDIGVRVEEQLAKQLMMCKNTRDHHKAMGDIAGMNRFENLALTVQKDLDLVRFSKRKNFPLPTFHYEKRSFNIVHCNTDLTDNEMEIIIVRGISYHVSNPKEVDTYVKVEFPLPNDEMFKAKTNVVKDTDCPDYDQHFKVEFIRGNRQFQRIFKRHGVKFEVYSRGGFLRSDTLIGTINVKLQALETKCDIHDTFDLLEGRKKIGGKLEIKLRVRNPILSKQMEHINEKWLVVDS